ELDVGGVEPHVPRLHGETTDGCGCSVLHHHTLSYTLGDVEVQHCSVAGSPVGNRQRLGGWH
ncbi:MAG: hypothetical protein ACK56F_10900, partial [bacterium]